MWPLHLMDYDSTFRREGILTPAPAGTNLEDIKLSQVSQSLIRDIEKSSSSSQKAGWWVPGTGERGTDSCNGTGSVIQEESVPLMDGGGGRTTM